MSYRSFKRVLGETSLERKCRFLFGACLFLLITGSFWWYGQATERLVHEKNISTGRHLVDAAMVKYHVEKWETREEYKPFVKALIENLENQDYQWEFLALEETGNPNIRQPASSSYEEDILPGLQKEYYEFLTEIGPDRGGTPSRAEGQVSDPARAPSDWESVIATDPLKGPAPPFRHRKVEVEIEGRPEVEYHYFLPLLWKKGCTTVACHPGIMRGGAESGIAASAGPRPPFRVVKIVIPYAETQSAINQNRAGLLATAIVTVFLAMVALYIVVRYVIVKPLQHLRSVSEQITRGDYSVRAQIATADEFEELAHSFNRMLRHLVEAHQQLRDVNADLDAKVDQLAQVNMQLYEANRLKSEFLANMSHELRTPLNSIIGFSDVLQGIDSLNDKQKRYVRNIGQSGRVLLDMINDILDLAKMESGKMDVSPTEFSIDSVIQAQCNLVRSLAEEKNIDLEISSRPGLPRLYQDQGKVQQIITNLLSNAIKFTPEGGRIVVALDRNQDGQLLLRVADTGVGIAKEDREIIFEKFRQGTAVRQGDDLTREYTGTGLGLSIVKELCKLLGGEITVESELGKGSTFTVCLPWSLESPYRAAPAAVRESESDSRLRADILASRRRAASSSAETGPADEHPAPSSAPSMFSSK